jgi:hypothetical protein
VEARSRGAYIEGAIPFSDVEVEEAVEVVDAHRLVLVHLWRTRHRRAGARPAATKLPEAGGVKDAAVAMRLRDSGGGDAGEATLALRLRDRGGGEAKAHEWLRHG